MPVPSFTASTVRKPTTSPNRADFERTGLLIRPKRNNPSTIPVVNPAMLRTISMTLRSSAAAAKRATAIWATPHTVVIPRETTR